MPDTVLRRFPSLSLARICAAALAFALAAVASLGAAQAELRATIRPGGSAPPPLPIAVTDFLGERGADISGIVAANLERSQLFRPLPSSAFIERIANPNQTPNFASWRQIGAEGLVVGQVQTQGDGRLRVEFRLWDVSSGRQLVGQAYFSQQADWRRVAHIVSDAIFKAVTGEEGMFDSRVVFVSETGPLNARTKRLAIMDQDGANVRYLTDGRAMALTPRFSPSQQEVAYMSYGGGQPRVFIQNVDSGRQELLGNFPGMTFAPRFSPDGSRIVMSQAQDGNSEVYSMDVRSRSGARLTNHPAIDTSPSFSPDGTQIVFNSDRGGTPQLYVMGSGGGEPTRISFGTGRYTTPVWSPRGDFIAFTKQQGGQFAIGIMRKDGSGERILSSSYLDEGPTWAPNGLYLIFFRQSPNAGGRAGGVRLYMVPVFGGQSLPIPTPTDASDPAWSPLNVQ